MLVILHFDSRNHAIDIVAPPVGFDSDGSAVWERSEPAAGVVIEYLTGAGPPAAAIELKRKPVRPATARSWLPMTIGASSSKQIKTLGGPGVVADDTAGTEPPVDGRHRIDNRLTHGAITTVIRDNAVSHPPSCVGIKKCIGGENSLTQPLPDAASNERT